MRRAWKRTAGRRRDDPLTAAVRRALTADPTLDVPGLVSVTLLSPDEVVYALAHLRASAGPGVP